MRSGGPVPNRPLTSLGRLGKDKRPMRRNSTKKRAFVRGQNINANFFCISFSRTLHVMDIRAESRGRPQQKMCFSAAPVMGRNFLTPGYPGVRVRNVCRKFGPKSLCLCCFFFPDLFHRVLVIDVSLA